MNNNNLELLMNDGSDGEPAKRVLQYIKSHQIKKHPIVGIYCGYAPIELIQAMGIVPAVLCAFSNIPIEAAETVLPANLCPLIKSSYGFIIEGTCPFYAMSQAVIAETTCDGKKKMFELIADIKPTFVMDLPQLPDEVEALKNWKTMILKLKGFLETTFDRQASDELIESSLQAANQKNQLMQKIFDFASLKPPVISWQEMYDVGFLALPSTAQEMIPILTQLIEKLEMRVKDGFHYGKPDSPRVLVTGCPVGGDATKIFKVIEASGGVVVALDACTGMKAFMGEFQENTGDPIGAMSERYLKIPCACMTPNHRRLEDLSAMIDRFKPDVIIDFVLQACHSYNVESYKVGHHVIEKHGLPYLKVETDYADGDTEQLKTRIQALFESI
ncbi:MAG: 2-hydroxyacyl-CoA dehydratase family protein [Proteobacteria bacterium]|nr:2-hydroxyacyl-CoA dehydratase family protein [Pseudomonadota bacterium]